MYNSLFCVFKLNLNFKIIFVSVDVECYSNSNWTFCFISGWGRRN